MNAVPPVGNANYAWVQHFIHHLGPRGIAGFVLAVVWSFGGTQDPARRRLARAYLIRALVVAGLVILFVAVAAMVFTAALHSQLAYYYYR